jgi:hypothetical protein
MAGPRPRAEDLVSGQRAAQEGQHAGVTMFDSEQRASRAEIVVENSTERGSNI